MQDEMFEKLHNIQVCQILKNMDLDIQGNITVKSKDLQHMQVSQFHCAFLAPKGI